eukprot:g14897.t1
MGWDILCGRQNTINTTCSEKKKMQSQAGPPSRRQLKKDSDNEAALATLHVGKDHELTDYVANYKGDSLDFRNKNLGDTGAIATRVDDNPNLGNDFRHCLHLGCRTSYREISPQQHNQYKEAKTTK